jgi:hypothetical protein
MQIQPTVVVGGFWVMTSNLWLKGTILQATGLMAIVNDVYIHSPSIVKP